MFYFESVKHRVQFEGFTVNAQILTIQSLRFPAGAQLLGSVHQTHLPRRHVSEPHEYTSTLPSWGF